MVWFGVIVSVLLLAGCGGEPRLTLPVNSSPTPGLVARTTPLVIMSPIPRQPMIGEVVWTTAVDASTYEPVDAIAQFPADASRLIAAVNTEALGAASIVEASWTYNGTPLERFTTRLTSEGHAEERWMSFFLERDPSVPWPAGVYEIAIALDGASVQVGSVEVADSE